MPGGLYCCVYSCGNNQKQNNNKSFFSFPTDPEKLAVWLSQIRREDLLETSKSGRLNQRICCDHFGEEDFKFTKKLKHSAIPHLKLPVIIQKEPEPDPSKSEHKPLLSLQDKSSQTLLSEMQDKCSELQCTSTTQTPLSLNTNTSRKIRLRMELTTVQKKLKLLENKQNSKAAKAPVTKDTFLKWCDQFLDEKTSNIVKCHISMISSKPGYGQPGYGAPPQSGYGQPGYGAPPQGGQLEMGHGPYPNVPVGGGVSPQVQQWFQAVDKDHSGFISAAELKGALVNAQGQTFSETACNLMIGMFDKDRSGTINVDEFDKLYTYVNQWLAVFKTYDVDQSGHIDEQELSKALTQMGFRFTPEFINFLVKRSDPIEGKVSVDHFIVLCVQIQRFTEAFRMRDTQQNGTVTIGFEDFLNVALSCSI